MREATDQSRMTARLIDSLYTESMVLADEARAYFDENGRTDRESLAPMDRVAFSCESLKVTTRLMHVIAWLLTRKAIAAGEIEDDRGTSEARRLGHAAASEEAALVTMPPAARALIDGSVDLYDRVARIDRDLTQPPAGSPAHSLLRRIERAL